MRRQSAQDQAATGERATQAVQRLSACRTVTVVEFDEHFDQLVDLVVRASLSGGHWLVIILWWHAARRGYETGNVDQLAKLFRSGVPLSRQAGQMLADVFDLCKLKRTKRGGQRKLFEISAETQKARAECDVRLLQREKSISELSADELRTKVWGLGLDVKMDDKVARAQDAEARRLGKLRNSKGRMSRANAIEQVVQHHELNELDVGKLANWMDGRTGARQRRRVKGQNFSEGGFSFWCIKNEHRAERSSPEPTQQRVEDARLDGRGAGPSDGPRCHDAVGHRAVPRKRSPN
jgi:hypothetical protein